MSVRAGGSSQGVSRRLQHAEFTGEGVLTADTEDNHKRHNEGTVKVKMGGESSLHRD